MEDKQFSLVGTTWTYEINDKDDKPYASGKIVFSDEENCSIDQNPSQGSVGTYKFQEANLLLTIQVSDPSPYNQFAMNIFSGVLFQDEKSGAGHYLGPDPGHYTYTMSILNDNSEVE